MDEIIVAGRKCFVYEGGSSDVLLIQPIGEHSLGEIDSETRLIRSLSGGKDFTMAMLLTDWNQDLPPWGASASGKKRFGIR